LEGRIAMPAQLPDDIEQKLLDGQRLRATRDLMERRGLALNEARAEVGRWLFERRQADAERSEGKPTSAAAKPEPR
jgi:hypothetical protein